MLHRYKQNEWSQHGAVNKKAHKLWREALIATVCNEFGYLHKLLGKWLVTHKLWEHVEDGNNIYRKRKEEWVAYQVKTKSRTQVKYLQVGVIVDTIPTNCFPITDAETQDKQWISSSTTERVKEKQTKKKHAKF
eukprot:4553745-Ditylum_brightwellii.AAC.1